MGDLLRLLPLRPRCFTNSSSAATVGEHENLNLVCDLSWMILGSCYVGTKFLNSTMFPNSGIMSDPGLDACLGLDHMLI